MGTGGRVSAFAAIHGEVSPSEPVSAVPSSSTRNSDISRQGQPLEKSFLAIADPTGNLPSPPKTVEEIDSKSLRIRLEKGEVAVVVGLYSLWVKEGEILLLGAVLRASSALYHVAVPVIHAIPSITAVGDSAEVEISTNDDGIRYLGPVSNHFAGIWEPSLINTNLSLSFNVLGYHTKSLQDVSKELRSLALEHWLHPIRALLGRERITPPRFLITGAKGSGKSTFCRVLINYMLTMSTDGTPEMTSTFGNGVLFLDIDPGHPEFSAPGVISLAHVRTPILGSPFTNLILPGAVENSMLRMHYLGANTPQEAPAHYQKSVRDLLSLYGNYENLPLVINTSGYNTGSGISILLSAMRDMPLTDIVQIGAMRNDGVYELSQSSPMGQQRSLTQVPSQSHGAPLKSGVELREMQQQSYLHSLAVVNGRLVWDPLPTQTLREILSPAAEMVSEVFMVVVVGQELAPEHIVTALNESVVAFVSIKPGSPLHGLSNQGEKCNDEFGQEMRIARTPNGDLPYLVHGNKTANPLDPETTECIGLATITTAETPSKKLAIRSPVSLAHINAEIGKGYRVALVLARQHGLWSALRVS